MACSTGRNPSMMCMTPSIDETNGSLEGLARKKGGACSSSVTDERTGGDSTEPFPSPRGLALQTFRAGLLTRLHPRPAPSHANRFAQWHRAGVVRPTAAGGCAGLSAQGVVTGFPFHPLRSRGARNLKREKYKRECKRAGRGMTCGNPQMDDAPPAEECLTVALADDRDAATWDRATRW